MGTKIEVTQADNELYVIASAVPAGPSTELIHIMTGNNLPVSATVAAGGPLQSGTYNLFFIGINWGGPSNYAVSVSTAGGVTPYTGGGTSATGVTAFPTSSGIQITV